jgi:hypothetical protein
LYESAYKICPYFSAQVSPSREKMACMVGYVDYVDQIGVNIHVKASDTQATRLAGDTAALRFSDYYSTLPWSQYSGIHRPR